jgi:peptide deformylase
MMLPICQLGTPVLRQVGRDLQPEEMNSRRIENLLEEMKVTMREAPGVGLAAPQIGESLQLAVIEDRAEYISSWSRAEREAMMRDEVPFHVIANPRLTVIDPGPIVYWEGCLSFEGFMALVPRARAVRVEALDEKGGPVVIEAKGWHARILQHEIDHLNGTVYIDRMLSRSLMSRDLYEKFWKGKSMAELLRELRLD